MPEETDYQGVYIVAPTIDAAAINAINPERRIYYVVPDAATRIIQTGEITADIHAYMQEQEANGRKILLQEGLPGGPPKFPPL